MISLKYLNPKAIIEFVREMRSARRPKLGRQDLHAAYKNVFLESVDGEAILEHLATMHFVGRPTIGKTDRSHAFNEGRKYVVESIIHVINNDLKTLDALHKAAIRESEEEV